MRLMLHTFKKDVRRLWPAAAATWVMLAALPTRIAGEPTGFVADGSWLDLPRWLGYAALRCRRTAGRGPEFLDHTAVSVARSARG